jgi:two-component system response regulator BaeR
VDTNRSILIVEDDERIARILSGYLTKEGFSTKVLNESSMVTPQVRRKPPDLILLDILLPGKDGLSIFKEIKSFADIPILFVTAKTQGIDRLIGFELGADDYICKPFIPREVVARVKAVLRRTYPAQVSQKLTAGSIYMDIEKHKVRINNVEIKLTPIQFKLLKCLMSNPDRVLSRNDLVSKIQGYNFDGYNRTIDTHIKNLRKKIQKQLPNQEVIHSVYGVGYSFSVPKD